MKRIWHNKLVRNKIPQIIVKNGATASTKVLSKQEYRQALLEKLVEEAKELSSDPGYEERADVAEVLLAIDNEFGFLASEIEEVRAGKAVKRGGFDKRIFLKYTDED
ncbi:MAG: nucleoside triphosphate pyrophosphohydrolase [Candidatus Saccharimonas sp.]